MRTRSGLIVNREAGRTDDMAEDNGSTEARWGTPAHTTSFSTVASHHQSSRSPRSAGNGHQQQYPAQQLSQNADEVSSNHSPYVATPPSHFSVSPLGDHSQQQGQDYFINPTTTATYYPHTSGAYQTPHSQPHHPSFYPPLQLPPPQQYYTPTTQEPEAMRRFSEGTRDEPWSPAAGSPPSGQPDRKRRFPEVEEFGEVTDRPPYPDKVQEELEILSKEGNAEGGRDKKRKKIRGRRSRPRGRGDKGERKDRDRDHYPDGYGEGGEGMGVGVGA